MPETQHHSVDLLGNTVQYRVRQSSDATEPRIDVDIHGVTVIVPEADDVNPETLLKQNAVWVVDKQRNYDVYREQVPDRNFEEGEDFLYLGDHKELVIKPCSKHSITADSIRLRQSAVEQSSVKSVLENYYRRLARDHLTERIDHYAEKMALEYEQLELWNQRTRWGSCSTSGTISLNWRLVMAPPDVIDYLVVHELAHLTEQHHGKEFWRLVSEYVPQYKQKAGWLERNSAKLVFGTDDV